MAWNKIHKTLLDTFCQSGVGTLKEYKRNIEKGQHLWQTSTQSPTSLKSGLDHCNLKIPSSSTNSPMNSALRWGFHNHSDQHWTVRYQIQIPWCSEHICTVGCSVRYITCLSSASSAKKWWNKLSPTKPQSLFEAQLYNFSVAGYKWKG